MLIVDETELNDDINLAGTVTTKYHSTSTPNESASLYYEYSYQGTFTLRTDN